ncbi:trifunctional hydroxymethylpyrimidine kinase/phosphomethylpyrimidine kinase/thiaminase [Tilletia horrida]|nr:trifunctional hydroxymethylpyrimidine kinase/phosphomethylpyrimidine kinase/thiaminase [Tilletia horrida]
MKHTIAGSDSGGGAGIQADLKTVHSLGAYGLSVVTALTAQSTMGVQGVHVPPPAFVRQQFQSVQSDIRVDAFKIGMLANEGIVRELGTLLKVPHENGTPIVLDPVMVSTSGSMLLPNEAVEALITDVFPSCLVVTPNVAEAAEILKRAPAKAVARASSIRPKHSASSGSVPSLSNDDFAKAASALAVTKRKPRTSEAEKALASLFISVPSNEDLKDEPSLLKLIAVLRDSEAIARLGSQACLLKGGHAPVPRKIVEELYGAEPRPTKRTDLLDDANNVRKDFNSIKRPEPLPSSTDDRTTTDDNEPRHKVQSYAEWESSVRSEASAPIGYVYSGPQMDIVRTDHYPWSIALERWSQKTAPEDKLDDDLVVVDVLYQSEPPQGQNRWTLFVSKHSPSTSTHGTGCTLSASLATFLAQGHSLRAACGLAINYVAQGIPRGVDDLGKGAGPLDHGLSSDLLAHLRRAIPPPAPYDRSPLCRAFVGEDVTLWRQYTRHAFVRRILVATDTTDPSFWDSFTYFLKQDYLFLQHYARMFALAAAATSASNHPEAQLEMASFSKTAEVCMHECQKHLALCEENGIARDTVTQATRESAAVVAYTRFVLDIGHGGGSGGLNGRVLPMLVAMGPCALGYAEVGLWLAQKRRELRKKSGEPESYAALHTTDRAKLSEALRHRIAYDAWIDTYSGDEFQDSVGGSISLMERKAQQDPPTVARLTELKRIWTAAVRLEIGMWDEAVDPSFRRPVVNAY